MPERVRVGFVGAGRLATRAHYPSLAEMDDVDLVAIAELDPDRLTATADRFGIGARHSDYRVMLEREELDAVYVIMPPHQLFDVAVACLRAGKHLMVEKPPGVTTYQTQALALHAEAHDCLTMVGFNRRYIPLLNRCKALVEERGPLQLCLAAFHKFGDADEQYGFYAGAVGHLTSDIIHAVDALRWLAGGEAVAVAADNRSLGMPFANSHQALLRFDTGCTAMLTAHRRAGARRHYFELHGDGISAYADDQQRATIYRDGGPEGLTISAAEAAGSDAWHKRFGFFAENRHFIDCVKAGRQPQTNLADAVRTMELVDRIARSQI